MQWGERKGRQQGGDNAWSDSATLLTCIKFIIR